VKPPELAADLPPARANPDHGIALHGHLAKETQRTGYEPKFGHRDVAVKHASIGLFGGMDAQLKVALIEDELVIFLADAKTGVEQSGAESAHGGSGGEEELHGGRFLVAGG
jgi:hypothetical protein